MTEYWRMFSNDTSNTSILPCLYCSPNHCCSFPLFLFYAYYVGYFFQIKLNGQLVHVGNICICSFDVKVHRNKNIIVRISEKLNGKKCNCKLPGLGSSFCLTLWLTFFSSIKNISPMYIIKCQGSSCHSSSENIIHIHLPYHIP